MSCRPVTAWLFGKLPTHGDFVSRGLAPEARDRLDRWLSDEMALARDQLGDMLGERFDMAAPWLFAHEDACSWEGGALCPSVDSAGRRFPLIVARQTADAAQSAAAARACIDAVYAAFGSGMTADGLWAAANDADLSAREGEPMLGWWVDGAEATERSAPLGPCPGGILLRMLERANA